MFEILGGVKVEPVLYTRSVCIELVLCYAMHIVLCANAICGSSYIEIRLCLGKV